MRINKNKVSHIVKNTPKKVRLINELQYMIVDNKRQLKELPNIEADHRTITGLQSTIRKMNRQCRADINMIQNYWQ